MNSTNAGERPLYVWFDTEYSTLEIEEARILQVAAMITDSKLRRIVPREKDIRLAIHLPEAESVSPWVEEHLPELVRRCRSPEAVDIGEADERLAQYVRDAAAALPDNGKEERPILAGNSVHLDWRLARKFLPCFSDLLHYRLLDVTALKLQWKRLKRRRDFDKENPADIRKYFPEAAIAEQDALHDAYYDVQASAAELAFYRLYMLR